MQVREKALSMVYEKECQIAIEAVLKACRLCQAVQGAHIAGRVIAKQDGSPVTVADFGAQAVVSAFLKEAFPQDALVSEEDAHLLRQGEYARLKDAVLRFVAPLNPHLTEVHALEAIDRGAYLGGPYGRFWTLDPIDGTKGFLRGGQYAVALALVEEGDVRVGVLGCPNLPLSMKHPQGPRGCLFLAVKGAGAMMRGLEDPETKPIGVSDVMRPAEAQFCESFESSHSSHKESAQVAKILGTQKPPLRMDSQCKYGLVARGDVSVYLRLPTQRAYVETLWDHAAGAIIVQEAGGVVTDLQGRSLDFSAGRRLERNRGVVATNGKLHPQVLHAVQQVLQLKR
jgi:3'(2'), 5'-bisphosphate nucleotidase